MRRQSAVLSRCAAEVLENRVLFASLFDLVGKTSFPNPSSPGSTLEQNAVQRPVDSQQDILWLANHVNPTTLLAMEKTSGELQAMYAQWLRDGNSLSDISIHNTLPADVYLTKGERLMTHLATTDADALADRLAQLGFEVAGKFNGTSDRIVDVYTPVPRIAEIALLPGVVSAVAQVKPLTRVGSAQSEWPGIANIPQLNLDLPGSDGTNIDYGVISDSINRKGLGVAGSQATLDLPPGNRVTVVQDGAAGSTDEGRGMSELIYDAAPDSDILFYGPNGPADFATGVASLANSGADVLVDDLAYLNVPIFQDGAMAQAIDSVVTNQKVLYFSAGGNENGKTYYGSFNEGTTTNNYHAFDSAGDEVLDFTLTAGSTITAGLHWGEKNGGATKDFDLRIQNSSGTVVASDTSNQIGGNPYTSVSYTNTGSSTVTLGITIFYSIGAGSAAGMPLFLDGSFAKGVSYTDNDWGGPSVRQQVNAAKAFAVGAVPASSPSTIESFSSLGGVKVVYDAAGNLINEIRARPDFVAADGVTTSFFPNASPNNVFFGTSAAAPDAAAIGGLLQEAAGGPRSLTYEQARDMLKNSAFDLGAGGFDTTFGAGRVDGLASVIAAKQNASNNSTYIELSPNGFGSFSGSMTTNSTIPSIYFSTSGSGNTMIQTISGSVFSWGSVFEYGDVGSQSLLETKRVDAGQIAIYSGWSLLQSVRHSVSAFARQDVSTVPGGTADDITFIVNAPVATKTTIPIDSNGIGSVDTTIGSNYEVDYYQFTTPASFDTAGGVNIGARFTGMDGVISVFDSSGNQLYRADASGFNSTETIAASTFAANTTYYLRVGSYNGNSHGSYHLGIRAAKSLAGGMLNVGTAYSTMSPIVPFGGASSTNDVGQYFSIGSVNAVAGHPFGKDSQLSGTFTINVDSTQFDPVIAVYAYNGIFGTSLGEMVAFDDDSGPGSNSQITFTAQPGFRHILVVKSFDNTVGTGTYTVTANYGGPPSSTAISLNSSGDGSVNTGSIAAGGEFSTYTFVAPATSGGATITLSNQVGDGDIYLFDSAGNLLGGNSTGGTGIETITVSSLTPGATYHITVMPEQYAATLSSATVSVDVATAATPAAPDLTAGSDLGISNTDNFTSASSNVNFIFSGPVGTFMRLFRDGVQVAGPTAVDSFGSVVLVDNGPITAGTHNYTATAALTASSGQTPPSPALAVTYEFTAPIQNSFDFRFDDAPGDHKMFIDFSENIYDFTATDPAVKYLTGGFFLDSSYFRMDNFSGGLNDFYFDVTAESDQLPDGDYEITIPAGAAKDFAGNPNPQALWNFWFLNGDANRDRKVDTQDFNILAGHFGSTGAVFSGGNFNYDTGGNVDSQDFNLFVSKYGKKLPALASSLPNNPPANRPSASPFGSRRVDEFSLADDEGISTVV